MTAATGVEEQPHGRAADLVDDLGALGGRIEVVAGVVDPGR
jgi:hypothetical protein